MGFRGETNASPKRDWGIYGHLIHSQYDLSILNIYIYIYCLVVGSVEGVILIQSTGTNVTGDGESSWRWRIQNPLLSALVLGVLHHQPAASHTVKRRNGSF